MNFMSTISGSMMEDFIPKGWDLEKIDKCCQNRPGEIFDKQDFWHPNFNPIACDNLADFNTYLGHEIAMEIYKTRQVERKLAIILPVGPMGMYKWLVYFLKQWNIDCGHVYGFNMDEWSDREGNESDSSDPGSFQYSMEESFYKPLGDLTVPENQRNFASKENLPTYAEKIKDLKAQGAKLVVVFGVGRVFHIAFWEPHFAEEFASEAEWRKQTHRLAAKLHPLTIEQNAITSFKSRTTLVPCYANTIGPGLFLKADKIIGGCDGAMGRGMMWQGMSLWVTLRYSPNMWVPSSYMPTLAGKLFFLKELAGPLEAECN